MSYSSSEQPSPFDGTDEPPSTRLDRFILVNGRTFAVVRSDGELENGPDGVVFEDLRMLSRFRIEIRTVDPPAFTVNRQLLGGAGDTPFEAVVVTRPDPENDRLPHEFYIHRQWIGRGVRHDIEIHNTGSQPFRRQLTVEVDSDFAHVFDVKAGRARPTDVSLATSGDGWMLIDANDAARAVAIRAEPVPIEVSDDPITLGWVASVPPRSSAVISIVFEPVWDGKPAGVAFELGSPPSRALPASRHDRWQRLAPTVTSDDRRLSLAVDRGIADLASLRIFDRAHAERVVVAAGAPWFMTLFGRDSLLTSWMAMPFLPDLALGTLDTLAELQGTTDRPETEEQPGKIIHELRRHGGDAAFAERGRYYGTVDATPLFVMVAAEAARWGHLDGDGVRLRWPAIEAALGWIRRGIEHGGGFLRYRRSTEVGLANQGWKDSWDGISHADGRLPDGPIALSEVQGYAYAALLAGAELVRHVDHATIDAAELRREADDLAERFDAMYWMESESSWAVGLDGRGRPIDTVTTNPGHAVWTGITDPVKANRYLDRILDGGLFSGWGLRTLSPTAVRYDPLSYHNGSVWPHDTAIVAAGGARIGRHDVFDRLFQAALDVAAYQDGRPPELFAGVDRDVIDFPVPYPTSCSPQAWSSASILLYLRSALGLEPPAQHGEPPRVDPAAVGTLQSLSGIRIGDRRYRLSGNGRSWAVDRLEESPEL